MRLSGASVLLTGASRGIGAALAAALRDAGGVVHTASRSEGTDVAKAADIEALFARTGPVDLVINNAGVIHQPADLVDIPDAEWRRLFDVNVFGMVDVLRRYVPPMNARGSGVVVNLSSTWGRYAAGRQSPYCATKFAVEALSQALAQEVAAGVVVMAVNPGVVATEMLATCFEGDVGGYTPPEACAASFVRMLEQVDDSWNGRSVDVAGF